MASFVCFGLVSGILGLGGQFKLEESSALLVVLLELSKGRQGAQRAWQTHYVTRTHDKNQTRMLRVACEKSEIKKRNPNLSQNA